MTDLTPVLLFATCVMAISAAVPQRDFGLVGSIPLAVVATTVISVVVGLVANWSGARLLSHPATPWILTVTLVAYACSARCAKFRSWRSTVDATLAASAGGALMTLLALVLMVSEPGVRLNWFVGGDNVRHVVVVADIWLVGSLDYAVDAYPRGWHALHAIMWSATSPSLHPDSIVSLLTTSAMLSWLAFAVLALTSGLLATRIAAALGGTRRLRIIAGVAGGVAPLWLTFSLYLPNGFQTSVIAALALAVAVLESASSSSQRRALAANGMAFVVVSHAWQILLPASGLLFIISVWRFWLTIRITKTNWRIGSVYIGTLFILCTVLSWPALEAVIRVVGLSSAASEGFVPPLPAIWLSLGVVVASWVAFSGYRRHMELALPAVAVLGTFATAVWLSIHLRIPITEYYPNKTLWVTAVLSVPLACAFFTVRLLLGLHCADFTPLRKAIGFVVVALILGSAAYPFTVLGGGWSTVDTGRVLNVVTSDNAPEASVVWTGDEYVDAFSRMLLDAYHVGTARERTIQRAATISELCGLLTAHAHPAVLSDKKPHEVGRRFSCVPDLDVLVIN